MLKEKLSYFIVSVTLSVSDILLVSWTCGWCILEEDLEDYVKVLLTYDINPHSAEGYYKFMLKKMVPSLERLGLSMIEAWHTAAGDHPIRLVTFVAECEEAANEVLQSAEFFALEDRLQEFVTNYRCRVVSLRRYFQY